MRRLLLWAAGLVLVAGIVAVLVEVVPNSNPSTDPSPTAHPAIVQPNPKTVKLPLAARLVAGRFILTAVRRRHLDEAWGISGPPIRQTQTYRQWLTGSIAVTPFLADIRLAPMKVDYSYRNHALLEVALIPHPHSKAKAEYFWIELKRVRGRWVVWTWVPRDSAAIKRVD